MANRVTEKDLQNIVDRINRICKTPAKPYVDYQPQAGCYHLSFAYGGVSLHQMAPTGTGESDVLRCGHVPKRELQCMMWAFICGIDSQDATS